MIPRAVLLEHEAATTSSDTGTDNEGDGDTGSNVVVLRVRRATAGPSVGVASASSTESLDGPSTAPVASAPTAESSSALRASGRNGVDRLSLGPGDRDAGSSAGNSAAPSPTTAMQSWPSTPALLRARSSSEKRLSVNLLEALRLTPDAGAQLDDDQVKDLTARRMAFVRRRSSVVLNDDLFEPTIRARFSIREKLGSGGYAEVYKVVERATQEEWALKVIFRSRVKNQKRLDQEVEALTMAKHPAIICLKETIHTPDHMYLLQDLASGGCLFDLVVDAGGIDERDVAVVMDKMLHAVAYLHGIGLVHRDIKLENILLTTPGDLNSVKLSDFGVVRILEDASKADGGRPQILSQVGSVAYMAPEIFLGTPYDESVDMWACGVLLYMLLSLSSPFGNDGGTEEGEMEQIHRIIAVDFNFDAPVWARTSASSRNLISRLLRFNPLERLSANEALRHAWIRQLETGIPAL